MHAYAQSHRRFFRHFQESMRLLEQMEKSRGEENWESCRSNLPQQVTDAAQDLIYRVTELFDIYLNDLPHFLQIYQNDPLLRKYSKEIKILRSPWATICNRCKHNHRYFMPVEVTYGDRHFATGFSVYGRTGNQLAPDELSLRGVDSVSYNWFFRRILTSVLQADIIAGALVAAIPDTPTVEPLSTGAYELPYASIIQKVISRPVLGMPGEIRGPSLSLLKETVNIALDQFLDVEAREGILRMWIDFLGTSVAFQAPYSRGSVSATLGPPEGLRWPTGLFVRIELANHRVAAPGQPPSQATE